MYLLEKSYLNKRSHGNATLVTRALTAMVGVNVQILFVLIE